MVRLNLNGKAGNDNGDEAGHFHGHGILPWAFSPAEMVSTLLLFFAVSMEFLYHDPPKQPNQRGTHAPYLFRDCDGADCIQSDSRRLEGISTARTRIPRGVSWRSVGVHRPLPYRAGSIGDRSHLFPQR